MLKIERKEASRLVGLTTGIVSAYVQKHIVPATGLAELIAGVHAALENTQLADVVTLPVSLPEKQKPAVPIRKSVTDAFIICLENGKQFKSMKRHLATSYNMTPDEYRAKWGLPDDYPMVARAYAEKRSQLARDIGLGQKRTKA
ncbi:MucR family transcriptional regulator [Rhizobium herbae]|uniref:Transcriptional regulator n=1 Tax=Rhizobium herbae TaxID=508661 RepID=A0ABS4EUX1_9HYPH|nr:MucR family transcriptional regulator [Rhizobium herbae]MBP1861749.1 putative transcriptional regulator [Rhizobium herbae]